jgi:hypothetical protein
MKPEDICKTAITTPRLYEYNRMPFGLCKAKELSPSNLLLAPPAWGLVINAEKCVCGASSIVILSHRWCAANSTLCGGGDIPQCQGAIRFSGAFHPLVKPGQHVQPMLMFCTVATKGLTRPLRCLKLFPLQSVLWPRPHTWSSSSW